MSRLFWRRNSLRGNWWSRLDGFGSIHCHCARIFLISGHKNIGSERSHTSLTSTVSLLTEYFTYFTKFHSVSAREEGTFPKTANAFGWITIPFQLAVIEHSRILINLVLQLRGSLKIQKPKIKQSPNLITKKELWNMEITNRMLKIQKRKITRVIEYIRIWFRVSETIMIDSQEWSRKIYKVRIRERWNKEQTLRLAAMFSMRVETRDSNLTIASSASDEISWVPFTTASHASKRSFATSFLSGCKFFKPFFFTLIINWFATFVLC